MSSYPDQSNDRDDLISFLLLIWNSNILSSRWPFFRLKLAMILRRWRLKNFNFVKQEISRWLLIEKLHSSGSSDIDHFNSKFQVGASNFCRSSTRKISQRCHFFWCGDEEQNFLFQLVAKASLAQFLRSSPRTGCLNTTGKETGPGWAKALTRTGLNALS